MALLLTTTIGCSGNKAFKLTIDYPVGGAVFNKPDLLICGSAPPGGSVVLLGSDPNISADRDGHWEYRTTLAEPAPTDFMTLKVFNFYLKESRDTNVTLLVMYEPGASEAPLSSCPAVTPSEVVAPATANNDVGDAARTAWLKTEVAALSDLGAQVLESFFNTPTIIWIRTSGLSSSSARAACAAVANDAHDHFGKSFTVHVYGPTGLGDELAKCNS